MNDRQRLMECIVHTAMYYDRQLTPAVVRMMADDLSSYDTDAVLNAYKAYRTNGKNRAFPLPSQIIEMLEGGNSKGNANALATKLIAAVKRHDYTWPNQLGIAPYKTGSFEGDFIQELGEEAWHVVSLHGGWGRFCESFWSSNEATFRAQLRDLCEDTFEKVKVGALLPGPTDRPRLIEKPKAGPNRQQLLLLREEAKEKGLTEIVNQVEIALGEKANAN